METRRRTRQYASRMTTRSMDELEERHPTGAVDAAALRVALVGYGEVGGMFGAALTAAGVRAVCAYDVLISDAAWAAATRERASRDRVVLAPDLREAVANCSVVISAVTAAATGTVAEQIASVCGRDT